MGRVTDAHLYGPRHSADVNIPVAVACGTAGAASYGLAGVAQQRAAKAVPTDRTVDPRLLVRLVRKPLWLAGTIALGCGLVLQIVALAFGPLVLVQPLGVTSAVWATVGRRWDGVVVAAAVAAAGGLALFLLVARPVSTTSELDPHGVAPLAVVFGVLVVVAAGYRGRTKAIAFAAAAGICYGVTAGLLKVVTAEVRAGGFGAPFGHWAVYVACLTGPPGLLLSQHAFQYGRLVSSALAVITTVDPLVAIAVGVGWLGERVSTTPVALAGEAVGAVAIVVGVAVLLRHGEHVRGDNDGAGQDRRRGDPVTGTAAAQQRRGGGDPQVQ